MRRIIADFYLIIRFRMNYQDAISPFDKGEYREAGRG
jgi:hypothetical protein